MLLVGSGQGGAAPTIESVTPHVTSACGAPSCRPRGVEILRFAQDDKDRIAVLTLEMGHQVRFFWMTSTGMCASFEKIRARRRKGHQS